MHVEFLSHWSSHLNRECMSIVAGIPVVFASSAQWAIATGMLKRSSETRKGAIFTLSSMEMAAGRLETSPWPRWHPARRLCYWRGNSFYQTQDEFDPMMTTGCSMSLSCRQFLPPTSRCFSIKCPPVVSMMHFFVGDNAKPFIKNSPADIFGRQNDGWFIDRFRQADIIVCTGLGDWEQDGLPLPSLKEAFLST